MVYDRSNDPMANQADMRDYKPREDIQSPQGLSAEHLELIESVLGAGKARDIKRLPLQVFHRNDLQALLNAARSTPPGIDAERLAEALFNSGACSVGYRGDMRMEQCRIHAQGAVQALAASPSVKGEDGWRPIESAPVGRTVDVWYKGDRRTGYVLDEAGRWSRPEGFPVVTRVLTGAPTHWRPLPAPPLPLQEEENK